MKSAILSLAVFVLCPLSWGADTGASPSQPGKKVIGLAPLEQVQIEMPDASIHDFGQDLEALLVSRFQGSGRYIVDDTPRLGARLIGDVPGVVTNPGDIEWVGSTTPSATVKISVDALSFRTGSRGESMFYGFNERFRSPFNDGKLTHKNEFPLREVTFDPNWFDRTFDAKGTAPLNSTAGLDLGDGIDLNVLFAWVTLKYAFYRSDLHLRVVIDSPLLGKHEEKQVQVVGKGFFYDLSGAYEMYSGGIEIARKDAMEKALANALAGSYDAIEKVVADYPLFAKIDALTGDGYVLLGTGPSAGVQPGTLYEVPGGTNAVVQVIASNSNGAVAKVVRGSISDLKPSLILQQIKEMPGSGAPTVQEFVTSSVTDAPEKILVALPSTNIPQPNLNGVAPAIDWAAASARAVAETVFLAYRVYRYFAYDQTYHSDADVIGVGEGTDITLDLGNVTGWFTRMASSSWAKQIGLDHVFRPGDVRVKSDPNRTGPVVAVIDTGVDYNHPLIHPSLWLNPNPVTDDTGTDRYGWDYISHDSRPYDDGYHGTQMASSVLAVEPQALIMPLKALNPFGITSSASLYESFRYAVDHGAEVILCGWATRKSSRALELGVAYAHDHGVLVVAAAGDRGDDLKQVPAYPASLAAKFDNVFTVTGVDSADQLVKVQGHFANFSPTVVKLAAPGQGISVAEPRVGESVGTSTGIAAALVAGAAARVSDHSYLVKIKQLLDNADRLPALGSAVQEGRRLRLR